MVRTLTIAVAIAVGFGGTLDATAQERTPDAQPALTGLMDVGPQHEALQKLVGEWKTTAELRLGPGQPLQRSEGVEVVDRLGGLWIRAEATGVHMSEGYHGALTLGYDPRREVYVGTYVDDRCNHLWVYEGTTNQDGTVLTLETEGPVLGASGRTARFKEVHEFNGASERTRTSYIYDRGRWVPYATVTFRRER